MLRAAVHDAMWARRARLCRPKQRGDIMHDSLYCLGGLMEVFEALPRHLKSRFNQEIPSNIVIGLNFLWKSAHKLLKQSTSLSHEQSRSFVGLVKKYGVTLPDHATDRLCSWCFVLQVPTITCTIHLHRRTRRSKCNLKKSANKVENEIVRCCSICGRFSQNEPGATKISPPTCISVPIVTSTATTIVEKNYSFLDKRRRDYAPGRLNGDFISFGSPLPASCQSPTVPSSGINLLDLERSIKKNKRRKTISQSANEADCNTLEFSDGMESSVGVDQAGTAAQAVSESASVVCASAVLVSKGKATFQRFNKKQSSPIEDNEKVAKHEKISNLECVGPQRCNTDASHKTIITGVGFSSSAAKISGNKTSLLTSSVAAGTSTSPGTGAAAQTRSPHHTHALVSKHSSSTNNNNTTHKSSKFSHCQPLTSAAAKKTKPESVTVPQSSSLAGVHALFSKPVAVAATANSLHSRLR